MVNSDAAPDCWLIGGIALGTVGGIDVGTHPPRSTLQFINAYAIRDPFFGPHAGLIGPRTNRLCLCTPQP